VNEADIGRTGSTHEMKNTYRILVGKSEEITREA